MSKIPRIFIAYAREDKPLLEKLMKPLRVLHLNGHCEIFSDGEILPGQHWDDVLKDKLRNAEIFVLLVTDDFLISEYINNVELPKALEREIRGEATVVPIILKNSMWKRTILHKFQVVLHDGRPIEPSDGYVHAADEIMRVIDARNETLRLEREEAEARRQAAEAEKLRLAEEARLKKEAEAQRKKAAEEAARRRLLDPFHGFMVPVEGGSFDMGGNEDAYEKPIHKVTVPSFSICKYPVTQAAWKMVMGQDNNPSRFKGDSLPVESVSWENAQDFIKKLNGRTGQTYSLPSEAEWEFAARGGVLSKMTKYSGSNDLHEVGWFWENSGDAKLSGNWDSDKITKNNCRTHPVGQKKANELELYDMSGNVWEWCKDCWHENYKGVPTDGSSWMSGGDQDNRVLRGGSWGSGSEFCRCANRTRGPTPPPGTPTAASASCPPCRQMACQPGHSFEQKRKCELSEWRAQ